MSLLGDAGTALKRLRDTDLPAIRGGQQAARGAVQTLLTASTWREDAAQVAASTEAGYALDRLEEELRRLEPLLETLSRHVRELANQPPPLQPDPPYAGEPVPTRWSAVVDWLPIVRAVLVAVVAVTTAFLHGFSRVAFVIGLAAISCGNYWAMRRAERLKGPDRSLNGQADRQLRKALAAVLAGDAGRMKRALNAIPSSALPDAKALALYVCGHVLNDPHGTPVPQNGMLLAQQLIDDLTPTGLVTQRYDFPVTRFLRHCLSAFRFEADPEHGPLKDQALEAGTYLAVLCAAALLARYRAEGETWREYLDAIRADYLAR